MKTITIDTDDVCLNLMEEWFSLYKKMCNYEDETLISNLDQWDLSDKLKYPKLFYSILPMVNYNDIFPIENSVEGCLLLKQKGYKLSFNTVFNPLINPINKYNALVRNGFPVTENNFIVTKDKSIISADYMIDDGIHNIISFPNGKCLFDAYWNRKQFDETCNKELINYNIKRVNWKLIIENWKEIFV